MVDELKEEPKKDDLIHLVISLNPKTNGVQVTGPIADIVLAYGMLECAKVGIAEHHANLKASKLIKPNGHRILDFVRGGK